MKPITMTNDVIENILANVRNSLTKMHTPDKTLNLSVPVTYTAPADAVKPKVIISAKAFYKMRGLVQQATEEVAWHGTVVRNNLEFTIKDIFVFPQEVTASTAQATDDYGQWIAGLDDATFDTLRFHGHSHVNMGVTPSAVDTNYQQELIDQVQDYYIFAIYNKRDDYNIWIYDKTTNMLYDKADIVYESVDQMCVGWAANQIKDCVKKRSYAATNAATSKPATTSVAATNGVAQVSKAYDWYVDGYGIVRHLNGTQYTPADILLLPKKEQKAIDAKINSIKLHGSGKKPASTMYDTEKQMTVEEYTKYARDRWGYTDYYGGY